MSDQIDNDVMNDVKPADWSEATFSYVKANERAYRDLIARLDTRFEDPYWDADLTNQQWDIIEELVADYDNLPTGPH